MRRASQTPRRLPELPRSLVDRVLRQTPGPALHRMHPPRLRPQRLYNIRLQPVIRPGDMDDLTGPADLAKPGRISDLDLEHGYLALSTSVLC